MADDEQGTSGMVPGLASKSFTQLRALTGRLEGLAGSGAWPPRTGAFPLPGALSATQLKSIAESVAAQRRSIEALQAQLAFDGQLAVLEQILGPLAGVSGAWADLEQRLLRMGHAPESPGGPPRPRRRGRNGP